MVSCNVAGGARNLETRAAGNHLHVSAYPGRDACLHGASAVALSLAIPRRVYAPRHPGLPAAYLATIRRGGGLVGDGSLGVR